MGHLRLALRELDEQPRVLRVAEDPDALSARVGELRQLAQGGEVVELVRGGDPHAGRRPHPWARYTSCSGKSCSVALTAARNLSASAPSTTRWSYDIVNMPIDRIAIASEPSSCVIPLGRFSIVPTPRIATCGWLMIGIPA